MCRDLKTKNVLLNEAGEAKIADASFSSLPHSHILIANALNFALYPLSYQPLALLTHSEQAQCNQPDLSHAISTPFRPSRDDTRD